MSGNEKTGKSDRQKKMRERQEERIRARRRYIRTCLREHGEMTVQQLANILYHTQHASSNITVRTDLQEMPDVTMRKIRGTAVFSLKDK